MNCEMMQMNMPYHADGENCRLFTPEEITTLYIKEMTNLTHNQTYTNQLKMYIKTLDDKESVESINYVFKIPLILPGVSSPPSTPYNHVPGL